MSLSETSNVNAPVPEKYIDSVCTCISIKVNKITNHYSELSEPQLLIIHLINGCFVGNQAYMLIIFKHQHFTLLFVLYCCVPARRGLQRTAQQATRHGARDPWTKLGNHLDKNVKERTAHLIRLIFTKTG